MTWEETKRNSENKAPKHQEAALKGQTNEIMRTPMVKPPESIVRQFSESSKEITRIYNESSEAVKKLEDEKWKRTSVIEDKIRELNHEKYKIEQEFNTHITEIERQANEQAKVQRESIDNAREYKLLLDVPEVPEITDDSITQYKPGRVLKWGNTIYSDPYVKLRYLIAENGKPTNRYSLVVIGLIGFGVHEELFTMSKWKPKGFEQYGHTHLNNNVLRAKIEAITKFNPYHIIVEQEYKTFPTVRSAEEYMQKHMHVTDDLIAHLQEKEKLLKVAKESYTKSDFEGIKERE